MAVNTSYNYYSSSYNSNKMRISGISSGFDTDSIVSALLSQQQAKVDKQYQAMNLLKYKKEAFEEVNTFIKDFRNMYMSTLKPETNIQAASTFTSRTVTSSDTTGAVTFAAGTTAFEGSHTISVQQLATSATVKGEKIDQAVGLSSTLDKVGFDFDAADSITFSINDKEFTFTKDTTISQMLTKINSDSDAKVTMTYSSLSGAFSISSKDTGSSATLKLANVSGNAFSETAGFRIGQLSGGEITGQNAIATIDGYELERSSNNFTIDGVAYTLNRTTTNDVSFTVTQDIEKAVEAVKSFVEGYNALIDAVNEKLWEKKYSAYSPLTEEQRGAMTENEANVWDKYAKSGTLKNDSGLQKLVSELRSAFYTKVDGGKTGIDIGITTMSYTSGSYDSSTGGSRDSGKIQLNEEVLRAALAKDPSAVADIFTKSSTSASTSTKYKESGLAQRMYLATTQYMYTTQANSIESIDTSIKNYEDSMDSMLAKMAKQEEKLYAQYTAMEKALSSMESQKNWLVAQLGGSSS